MAIDLGDLVENLEAELSPPGEDLYPNAEEEMWIVKLQNAFWEARLAGMLEGFTESEGSITPIDGDEDLARDLQQVIVLYAALSTTTTQLMNVNAVFRAKAGPVEFEVQKQATLLRDVLKALQSRIGLVIERLGDVYARDAAVFDAVVERTYSMLDGETWWLR